MLVPGMPHSSPQALVPHPSSPQCQAVLSVCVQLLGMSHGVRAAVRERHHHIMLNSYVLDKGHFDVLMYHE